jgi:sugar (pentulose or hexulose) kinase
MGGVRPNASKKGQIGPSTTVWAARGDGSCPNCASALQEGGKTASIHGSSGVIWRIPARITFGRSKSNVGGCRAKFNRCLRPNWRSWPQRWFVFGQRSSSAQTYCRRTQKRLRQGWWQIFTRPRRYVWMWNGLSWRLRHRLYRWLHKRSDMHRTATRRRTCH